MTDLDAVAIGDAATVAFVLEPPRHSHLEATPLAAGKYLIGSADDCQIRLSLDGVQPHHALLIVGARKSLLKAWDERTWINDWPVKESVLRAGDRISIGPVTLRWRAARAEELPAAHFPATALQAASQRQIDNEDSLTSSMPKSKSHAVEFSAAPIVPRPVAAGPAVDTERLSRQEQRLEELTRRLDARAESLQQEFDRQSDEFRRRESEWVRQQNRTAEESVARERELQTRRLDIEARKQQLDARENDLVRREAEWAANHAVIRSAWETTQREGDQKIAERLEALQSDRTHMQTEIETNRRLREDLSRLEQTLVERERALADSAKDFEERHALADSDRTVLDEALAEQERAVREFDAERARLASERRSLADEQAALAEDRAALDEQRRQWTVEEQSLAEERAALDEALAEHERAVREFDAERARLASERQSLADEQAALAEDRAALDEQHRQWASEGQLLANGQAALAAEQAALNGQRREFMDRLTESDERQRQINDMESRWREAEKDLIVARREIQAERAALDDERAAIAADRLALAAEREIRPAMSDLADDEASCIGADELDAERGHLRADRESLQEQRRLFEEEQTALLSQMEVFETRQREWQETAEQHRLSAEARDRDLEDRQQELVESSARLLEARREWELRRADLDDSQQKLQAAIAARESELAEAKQSQSHADQLAELLRRDQEELIVLRQELDAARAAWQLETEHSRQALEARALALSDAEAQLVECEAEWIERHASLAAETPPPAAASATSLQVEIERLTEELNREQEYRQTVESQLEGIRTRHERDAELWNTERTDWMVERDLLERELQAAMRQAASRPSKSACADVPAAEYESAPIDNIEEDQFRPASGDDDRPRWNDAEEAAAVTEREDNPNAAFIEDHGESASDADPLNQVRAELAKMFDLSAQPPSPASASSAEREEPPQAEPPRAHSAPLKPAAPAATDWESRLEALRRQAELESSAAAAQPVASVEAVHEPSPAAEEEDSIAAYMERMLARNRKGDEPIAALVSRLMPVADRSALSSTTSSTDLESSAPPSQNAVILPQPKARSKPRTAPDKGAVREHLDVFRDVANASARKAVAKHSSRQIWMLIVAKGIVALVCAVAAGAFLYVSTFGQQDYHWQALGCGVLGLVVGLDLLRRLIRPRRVVAKRPSPGRNLSTVGDDEESSIADDDEGADEIA